MITIIDFPHVLLFDEESVKYPIGHYPDNIEHMLIESPVVTSINGEDEVIGFCSFASNRPNTGRYYGDIKIKDEYSDFKKIEIIKTDIIPDEEHPNTIKEFITYIKKIKE